MSLTKAEKMHLLLSKKAPGAFLTVGPLSEYPVEYTVEEINEAKLKDLINYNFYSEKEKAKVMMRGIQMMPRQKM